MLALLATPFIRQGGASGKVLEFSGEGLLGLDLDERATLTNMSAEAGAFTKELREITMLVREPDTETVARLALLQRDYPNAQLRAVSCP